jgi:hypothetical protein
MIRHYKVSLTRENEAIQIFVPIKNNFVSAADQVEEWVLTHYPDCDSAVIIQKSSKRIVHEEVL